MRSLLATLALAAGALACGASSAGTVPDFRIDWYSIDSGGGQSTSADLSLRLVGSLGQHEPDVIPLCSAEAGIDCVSPVLQLTGGFWAGIAVPPVGPGPGCAGAPGCLFINGFETSDAGGPP